ncbi:sulfotransferase [Croceitalea rosinachiae]|uniref:IdeS/Mac family cysteine endopeptidase n=1 Tax=Croceitalea rosinachiae TaxID=3075596 RepID=A0ABU3ABD2_9FLAO|nr:IdeS/Mac family cysteine endopeptidase [Croceitalea sp. F388]MDT0606241.1 IdeS/Mac family cysteine endopeptidase [Croceitalea sp. F388]
MSNRVSLIYLLGAGRSGTTLLATVLNNHPKIKTLGEMHQFFEHLEHSRPCSCGVPLNVCDNWSPIIEELGYTKKDVVDIIKLTKKKQKHKNILTLLLFNKSQPEYIKIQNSIFEKINNKLGDKWLLDSSKYIARYLMLKQSEINKIKGIYMVRDVRGVINSFSKKVQTTKTPVSTIVYYYLINFFGQIVCWLDKDVIKVKYENFTENTEETLVEIYNHIFDLDLQGYQLEETYEIPHIVGGNRLKSSGKIRIKIDDKWKKNISRPKQIIYYILSFPLMIFNRYKV